VPSHNCRANTKKQYLPQELTLSETYHLYEVDCKERKRTAAMKWVYYDIFHKEFNLGVVQPKKDQCDTCQKFANSSESEKLEMKLTWRDTSKTKLWQEK